jgi:hypothetical protein
LGAAVRKATPGNGHRVASPRTAEELAVAFTYVVARIRAGVERLEAAQAERDAAERGRAMLTQG